MPHMSNRRRYVRNLRRMYASRGRIYGFVFDTIFEKMIRDRHVILGKCLPLHFYIEKYRYHDRK